MTRGGINEENAVLAIDAARERVLALGPQVEAISGRPGTDTEAFLEQSEGVSACYLGVPHRYMHTTDEMVDTADLRGTVNLLEELATGEGRERHDPT